METLALLANKGRLVIFAGAGVSMAAPSSLPSWWAINEATLASLARRIAVFTDKEFSAAVLQRLVATRDERRGFAPDYQAQIIENECGLEYFRVLQALDATDANANHAAIARLAAAGHVAAVITTNFDRLIEIALEAEGVRPRVFSNHEQFQLLPAYVSALPKGELPVIKVHGSVESPESMVDTLRQRLMGRPEALELSVCALLASHHVLFAGFSGADLGYDPSYLGLRAAAANSRGFTALLRTGDEPHPAFSDLRKAWGDKARFVRGDLPGWWNGLLAPLHLAPVEAGPTTTAAAERMAAVDAHVDRWAGSLGHMLATAILAELLEASGRWDVAYELLVRTYQCWSAERDMEAPGYSRFHYQLARRLLDLGQFDHRLDSQRAREAQKPGASPYTYTDCYQSIQRSLMDGKSPDGHVALGLYDTLRGMPQDGAKRIRTARDVALKHHCIGTFIDACRTLAVPYEILMHYADALEWLEHAYRLACRFGDEPRRAALCAEMARFLAMKERMTEAHQKVAEGLAIAQRLQLASTHLDLMAAGGGVFVSCGDGEHAVEWLDPAIDALRKLSRGPALLRALIDACHAAGLLASPARFGAVHDEMLALAKQFPGYEPLVWLTLARVHRRTGNVTAARKLLRAAQESAVEFQNPGVAEEAQLVDSSMPSENTT